MTETEPSIYLDQKLLSYLCKTPFFLCVQRVCSFYFSPEQEIIHWEKSLLTAAIWPTVSEQKVVNQNSGQRLIETKISLRPTWAAEEKYLNWTDTFFVINHLLLIIGLHVWLCMWYLNAKERFDLRLNQWRSTVPVITTRATFSKYLGILYLRETHRACLNRCYTI
jgi:hypothetical protein